MASPSKRHKCEVGAGDPDTPPDSSNDGEEEEEDDDDFFDEDDDEDELDDEGAGAAGGGQEIQVEFEARTPEECDFHGVKRLLQKLFNVTTTRGVDIGGFAQFVLRQRNVGSVITQSKAMDEDADEELSDEEEFEDLNNEVFGVTTVLKLTGAANGDDGIIARQVREYLVDIAKKEGGNIEKLTTFLGDQRNSIGFLVSERIMNIPPQISRPLYETLFNEIRKAKSKRLPFDFTHFILVARCLRPSSGGSVIYVNAEEEMLEEESDFVVEVDCSKKGNEQQQQQQQQEKQAKVVDLGESEYENTSKILVLDATKCDRYLTLLNNLFPI